MLHANPRRANFIKDENRDGNFDRSSLRARSVTVQMDGRADAVLQIEFAGD